MTYALGRMQESGFTALDETHYYKDGLVVEFESFHNATDGLLYPQSEHQFARSISALLAYFHRPYRLTSLESTSLTVDELTHMVIDNWDVLRTAFLPTPAEFVEAFSAEMFRRQPFNHPP
jgi:hypothetical protein